MDNGNTSNITENQMISLPAVSLNPLLPVEKRKEDKYDVAGAFYRLHTSGHSHKVTDFSTTVSSSSKESCPIDLERKEVL